MTGLEFRESHGNPAVWTDDAYELYALVATPGAPAPAHVLDFIKQPPPTKTSPDYQPAA
ncbi:hypothetical protein [Streptomyces cylindrosporus]|uniref:Uncharacterized protein n=1 Tax=Streptomyces cylindrosporus TaxID=2927583 RepID=A0ABS9YR10_9ACTN|nr:hypothetical protein [Streptomyces cylindrosporus]MCI3279115.1 hypothetical protein [Streptomyces cylindrosporus]